CQRWGAPTPPWAGSRRASTATTIAWFPNASDARRTSSGSATAAVLMPTLSAPASRSARTSSTDRTPPPTVSGRKTLSAVARTTSSIVLRPSDDAVMSRKQISSAPCVSYAAATATGSPASRSSLKRTPFLTRPASTSRHGITRLHSMSGALRAHARDRLLDREHFLVQRLADHHRGRARRRQRVQILEARHAPRRDDRAGEQPPHQPAGRVQVRTAAHAVARDVRVEDRRRARARDRRADLQRVRARGLRPSLDGHLPFARVDGDDDAARPARACRLDQRRILDRRRPEDREANAGIEQR